ncbi:hypothetical protein EJ131_06935 [Bacillus mycoides]|nr:hypothetical protein [Bacillus mycoides]
MGMGYRQHFGKNAKFIKEFSISTAPKGTDLVLQILSWLAEEERIKNKVRQRQGIGLAFLDFKLFFA